MRVRARELRAEEEDLRRVIDPHQNDNQRTGSAVSVRETRFAEIQPYE